MRRAYWCRQTAHTQTYAVFASMFSSMWVQGEPKYSLQNCVRKLKDNRCDDDDSKEGQQLKLLRQVWKNKFTKLPPVSTLGLVYSYTSNVYRVWLWVLSFLCGALRQTYSCGVNNSNHELVAPLYNNFICKVSTVSYAFNQVLKGKKSVNCFHFPRFILWIFWLKGEYLRAARKEVVRRGSPQP